MSVIFALALLTASQGLQRRDTSEMVAEDRDEVRRRSARFGACVVGKKPALAKDYVLGISQTSQGTHTIADAIKAIETSKATTKKLLIGDCLFRASDSATNVKMTFPGDTMRYALADAFFKKEFASRPPLGRLEQIPSLNHDFFLNKLGECVVRRNPQAAHALLGTKVLSPEENAAFGGLKASMADCLPASSTVKLNKMLIRGAVAYNYILLANAPRASAPGGSAAP